MKNGGISLNITPIVTLFVPLSTVGGVQKFASIHSKWTSRWLGVRSDRWCARTNRGMAMVRKTNATNSTPTQSRSESGNVLKLEKLFSINLESWSLYLTMDLDQISHPTKFGPICQIGTNLMGLTSQKVDISGLILIAMAFSFLLAKRIIELINILQNFRYVSSEMLETGSRGWRLLSGGLIRKNTVVNEKIK